MSAYSHINGMIYCDDILDGGFESDLSDDICTDAILRFESDLSDDIYADVILRNVPDTGILFSFGIKEVRLEYFFNLMEKWKCYRSLDYGEWHPIEVYLTLWYESDNERVDCLRIRDGEISHRETYA